MATANFTTKPPMLWKEVKLDNIDTLRLAAPPRDSIDNVTRDGQSQGNQNSTFAFVEVSWINVFV
jgi:hypothetical protein